MTDTLSYNTASEQVSEVFSGAGATLVGFSVVNVYDDLLRRSSTEAKYSSTLLAHFDYGTDEIAQACSFCDPSGIGS